MARPVHYCTTEDDVRIAYTLRGEGPPLLVLPLLVESFSLEHMIPFHRTFLRRMGRGRQLILFDMRGTGLSQRDVTDLSHAGFVRDLEAVILAVGLERVSIWAEATGGPRAIEYAARHPERVSRLILYGTTARPTEVMPPESLQGLATMARGNWAMAAQTLADIAGRRQFPEALAGFADMYLETTRGDIAARILEEVYAADVSHLLPTLKSETLVIHRMSDPLFPFATGQSLAAQIPRARFVPLEGNVHTASLGDTQSVLNAVNDFLREDEAPARAKAPAEPSVGFRTVLFTDMEGSTTLTQRLGDAKAQEVLRAHNTIVRDALKTHGGSEVKHTGDGVMASFPSASRALQCAIAIQRTLAAFSEGLPRQAQDAQAEPVELRVRIGLNAGEPIAEDEDLFGTVVQLAARVCAKAEPGQILVSDVVRQLAAGKAFLFSDRGEVALRGFEDPVRLYEVAWQE